MKKLRTLTYLAILAVLYACDNSPEIDTSNPAMEAADAQMDTISTYLADNNISAIKDSSGYFFYRTITENPSARAVADDYIVDFYYTLTTLGGQVIGAAVEGTNEPAKIAIGNGYPRVPVSLEGILKMMKEGEEYEFYLPAINAYQNFSKSGLIPDIAIVRARVKIDRVRTEIQERQRQDSVIREYIAERELGPATYLDSGVYYIQTQASADSTSLASAQTVNVYYKGLLLDSADYSFDSNLENSTPTEFPINNVIAGFKIGLRQMYVGEKGIILLPSYVGYGARSTILPSSIISDMIQIGLQNVSSLDIAIPSFAPLRFDVEVVSAE